MGNLKKEALETNTEDIQTFKLTDPEVNYLKLLNMCLQFHTMGQKMMSGFLYYVCTNRLGYKDGVNLQFEFDFAKQDNMLTIKLLPENPAEAAAATEGTTPPAPSA